LNWHSKSSQAGSFSSKLPARMSGPGRLPVVVLGPLAPGHWRAAQVQLCRATESPGPAPLAAGFHGSSHRAHPGGLRGGAAEGRRVTVTGSSILSHTLTEAGRTRVRDAKLRVEIRFSKLRLASRVYRSKVSPLEDLCPSLDSTTSATPLSGRCVRPACEVPCLAGGPSPDTPLAAPSSFALPWAEG
jgi:hypothetical protein